LHFVGFRLDLAYLLQLVEKEELRYEEQEHQKTVGKPTMRQKQKRQEEEFE